jgi:PTH1 family peptidyl-tRNA hydrolase
MVVNELAARHGLRFGKGPANADSALGNVEGTRVIIAKPLTYMNLSGRAVAQLAHYYKVPHNRVLVVYDDIALPIGTIRIREKGSAGGHNGLANIIQHLGTQHFPRVRVGVDRPVVAQHKQVDWVLGRFSGEEREIMDKTVPEAAEAIEAILLGGIERAMNRYNTRGGGKETSSEKADAGKQQQAQTPQPPSPPASQPRRANPWVEKLRSIYGGEEKQG